MVGVGVRRNNQGFKTHSVYDAWLNAEGPWQTGS